MLRVRALVRRNVTNVIEAFLAFTSVCQIPIKFSEPRKRAFCAPALLSNSHIWLCNTTLCMAARMHRSPVTHLRCPGAICRLLFFHGMTREKKNKRRVSQRRYHPSSSQPCEDNKHPLLVWYPSHSFFAALAAASRMWHGRDYRAGRAGCCVDQRSRLQQRPSGALFA